MKTILAPVDFSPVTEAVVSTAAGLARAWHGKVVLLSVIQPPTMVAEYAPLLADIAEVVAAGEKNAERALAKLEAKLKAEFVEVETAQFVGPPIATIVEQAEKLGADYIVMGSHGHTALYDLLVGSTTHGVLMRAKCPLVIVPGAKEPPKKKIAKRSRELVG
jgi:nucleotide-binding universal stress UspA family protein